MVNVVPISGKSPDAAHLSYYGFMHENFTDYRLGRPGQWFGSALELLPLGPDVNFHQFDKLMHGQCPNGRYDLFRKERRDKEPLGWRLTFRVPRPASLEWGGQAEFATNFIEHAHGMAVKHCLQHAEKTLCGPTDWNQERNSPLVLFAAFQCGTTPEQRPDLHTVAFLFNVEFHRNGHNTLLSPRVVSKLESSMDRLYEQDFLLTLTAQAKIAKQLTWLHNIPKDVSPHLWDLLTTDRTLSAGLHCSKEPDQSLLRSEELRSFWERQVTAFQRERGLAEQHRLGSMNGGTLNDIPMREAFRAERLPERLAKIAHSLSCLTQRHTSEHERDGQQVAPERSRSR